MAVNPVIHGQGVTKSYQGRVVLQDLSLTVQPGEIILLRGENGSGKTTLLNILSGMLTPDRGTLTYASKRGSEVFHFPKTFKGFMPNSFLPEHLAHLSIGRTWQDTRLIHSLSLLENLMLASPSQTGEHLRSVFTQPGAVTRQEQSLRQAASQTLQRIQLQNHQDHFADNISLGQMKRVAISRAVETGAHTLFLDEPFAGLDTQGAEDVVALLQNLSSSHQVSMIIVEHEFNLPRVLKLADTVWTLDQGHLTSSAANALQADAGHPPDQDLPNLIESILGPDFSMEQQHWPGHAVFTLARRPGPIRPTILEVSDITVNRGRRPVIGKDGNGLSFSLKEGDLAILQAPNGWGKTTLLESINGLVPVHQGTILLQDQDAGSMTVWERAQCGVRTATSRDASYDSLTIAEALQLAECPKQSLPPGIPPLIHQTVGSLSGGERQKMSAACAANAPGLRLGLFDEPFTALDSEGLNWFNSLLKQCTSHSAFLLALPAGSIH